MGPSHDEEWSIPRDIAIPKLLELHGGRLLGLSTRICGDRQEAEDLLQSVFLQAWRNWDQFRGESSPYVWLYTIARHACQRMHRRRSGEPQHLESLDELLPFGEPKMAMVQDDSDVVDDLLRREQEDAVGQAIAALPVDFRMAVVLKEIIGFTVEEVAEILGIPEGTVKTRLHRGRLKLRRALEAGLPRRNLPPPAYSKQVCLDLLQAKQESLDRGVEMANADQIICERCAAVFATLDLGTEVCRSLSSGEVLPEQLRQVLLDAMRGESA